MEKIGGVAAHPLLVHVPVVLIPLAALGALAMLVWPASRRHINWITAGAAIVGALGTILAASAGEGLQETLEHSEGPSQAVRHHAQLGEDARTFAIIFAIVIVAFVAWEFMSHRKATAAGSSAASPEAVKKMRMMLLAGAAVTVIVGGLATYKIVDAGHSGAKSTWGDVGQQQSSSGDSGSGTTDSTPAPSGDSDND